MRERLAAKLATSGRPASVEPWPAEALLAADASFDTVVCTMVLCTVRDPDRALAEVRRVLAPGGRLLVIEHVRSRRRGLALLQQAMTPVYVVMARGCHPNRDTLAAIVAAGFEVERHRREIAPCTPAMERELIIGAAQRPGAGATGRRGGP
jgi:SAM-dependent methyltransferase